MTLVDVEFGFDDLTEKEKKEFRKVFTLPKNYKGFRGIYTGGVLTPDSYLPNDKVKSFPDRMPLGVENYGVADNIDQVIFLYGNILEEDERKWFIHFDVIKKKHQPKLWGWRWHKWGPYIGCQEPTEEYLKDEPKIKKVIIFHLYEVIK